MRDMGLPVQKHREAVLQFLYSMEFHASGDDELLGMLMQELKISKKNALLALMQAKKVKAQQEHIDKLITEYVDKYAIKRFDSVERNICRLAIYECVIDKTLPIEVTVAEAKRLVRKFGHRESEPFIQAVVDAIYKDTTEAS